MVRQLAGTLVLTVFTTLAILVSSAAVAAADQSSLGAMAIAAGQAADRHPDPSAAIGTLLTVREVSRGNLLSPLYVSLVGLNAYDAYATLTGVARGAAESNGLIAVAARSPAALWTLKAGATLGPILVSERLWRTGHRAQAIGMMVAANVVMTFVGAHNYRVLGRQQ